MCDSLLSSESIYTGVKGSAGNLHCLKWEAPAGHDGGIEEENGENEEEKRWEGERSRQDGTRERQDNRPQLNQIAVSAAQTPETDTSLVFIGGLKFLSLMRS